MYFGKRGPICQRNLLRPSSQWKFEECKRGDKYREKQREFKGRPFLTFLLSHIRSLIARSQLSLRPFLQYISSPSSFATKMEITCSSGNPGPIC